MLNRVTLTGADDGTNINELMKLSREFPLLVEWGILIGSKTRNRFPSMEWIRELVDKREDGCGLSLHICGPWLSEIANGGTSSLIDRIGSEILAFTRCQLNWHGQSTMRQTGENILAAFCKLSGQSWEPEIIFQLDGVNDDLYKPSQRKFVCTGLFDRSHGAGVLASEWPKCREDIACGWAGGLGPNNLAAELPRIDASAWKARDYWVDMETKLRNEDDEFDLDRCRQCLEIAKSFIETAK